MPAVAAKAQERADITSTGNIIYPGSSTVSFPFSVWFRWASRSVHTSCVTFPVVIDLPIRLSPDDTVANW
ncbi:hypothetical protein E4U54_004960 [Claviceps lovelessii]|nr:hypothetical protein E4U54_004960 [Claviceps lovelessii]